MESSPADIISAKRSSVVESYNFTQTKNCNWASSLTKLAHATAQEYEDRFLIELIQNGYDVHDPDKTDGHICIHFARGEGEFGTLYVANGGRQFTASNFHAICEIAQSDKEPGAGIGNKGVGFKSVLHVCDSPEIYSVGSCSQDSRRFDGFCFRFALDTDYADLCDGNGQVLETMKRDVSPYFLPIHIPNVPEQVERFSELGMVSVIRMPLSRHSAATVASEQLEQLRASPVPVLLFLPRIAQLVIEESHADEAMMKTVIHRSQQMVPSPDPEHSWSNVTIQRGEFDSDGEHAYGSRTFFVATTVVESQRLKEAIDQSIEQSHLDQRFAEWTEEAAVSVAIEHADDTPTDCRLYTFLPMGDEARSPFGGHLNAPFAPNLARTHVNRTIPLNGLFFDVAAELAAETVIALSQTQPNVPESILIDLLTWESSSVSRLVAAFENTELPLVAQPLLPLVPAANLVSRGSIEDTFGWKNDFLVVRATDLRRITGLPFLAPVDGTARFARVMDLFASLDSSLDPTFETLADWIEDVAEDLLRRNADAETWNNFYSDAEALFAKNGAALEGRRVLLDSSRTLRQAGPFHGTDTSAERPAVFFPPITERSEDDEEMGSTAGVSIPKNLLKYMCYLHDDLVWYERDGTTLRRTKARDFLQKAHLVQRFDTSSLIEHCSRISQNTRSNAIRESALRLAFNLQRAARSRDALGLEKLAFQVPAKAGWCRAEEALFSEHWPDSQGVQLVKMITKARSVSDDIAALDDRFLCAPTESPFNGDSEQEWRDFLERIGVRDGLWPVRMPLTKSDFRGDDVTKSHIGRALKMSDDAIEQWEQTHDNSQSANHPYTDYRAQSSFYRIPGQFEFSQFTSDAKNVYARLIFSQVGFWKSDHFSTTIERPRPSRKDTLNWPTPLAAFLRLGEWVPVQIAAIENYVPPDLAWHCDESDGSLPPTFLPLIPRDLRRCLEQCPLTSSRMIDQGWLRLVGRTEDTPALIILLGEIVADDRLGETDVVAFRRLYRQAWQRLFTAEAAVLSGLMSTPQLTLAISRGSETAPLQIRDQGENCSAENLCVVDSDDRLRKQLLTDLRFPTLDVGSKLGLQVLGLLQPALGDYVRGSSSIDIEVLVDGESVTPIETCPTLLDDENGWVKQLVALVIQLKSRVPTHHTAQAQSQVQKRLSLIRAKKGGTVSLLVDRVGVELPHFFHDAVLINDADYPTIAYADESDSWTWNTFERLAPAIVSAVDRSSLQDALEVAIHRLSRNAIGEHAHEPTDEDLADALSTSVEEIRAHLQDWRSHELSVLEYLFPVIYHLLGADAAEDFDKSRSPLVSRDEIRDALVRHQSVLPIDVDNLLGKCSTAATLGHLREDLGLNFGSFNATLKDIGPPYKPTRNVEGHRNEFAFFLQHHTEAILIRVRNRFIQAFHNSESLDEYVAIRDLKTLQPDPNWLETCELPSDTMMRGLVNVWLNQFEAESLDGPTPELPALQMLRTQNRKLIRGMVESLSKVLPVWCSKNGVVPPNYWNEPNLPDSVADSMLDAGLTDFEVLLPVRVFQWLAEQNVLPTEMPHSTDHATLGLSSDDLSKGESEAEKQRRQAEYQRRTIEIDGQRYSSSASEYESLLEKIRDSISDEFLKSPKSLSKLESIAGNKKKRDGKGRNGGGASEGRMTDAQKHATGFAGEILALEWLKSQYDGVTEDCWKSKYRDLVFGGELGNDMLGYDFEVLLRNTSYMFEVKATTGTDCVIELGATELETSQRFAKSNRYRILFVSRVLDASRRKVFVLPNPFSKRGRGTFQATGTGIRFRFTMD